MVYFQDSVGHTCWWIGSRIPARNRSVLRGKNKDGLLAWCNLEIRWTAVENDTCGSGLRTGSKAGRRNHDKIVERTVDAISIRVRMRIGKEVGRVSASVVKSGGAGVVVANPPRAALRICRRR